MDESDVKAAYVRAGYDRNFEPKSPYIERGHSRDECATDVAQGAGATEDPFVRSPRNTLIGEARSYRRRAEQCLHTAQKLMAEAQELTALSAQYELAAARV